MSNPLNSPPDEASNGSIIGPIETAFQLFKSVHSNGSLTEDQIHNSRIIFYYASYSMYNLMAELFMYKDPEIMAQVTEAVRHDLETYLNAANELVIRH